MEHETEREHTPVFKGNREPNKYRLNELFGRFRSLCLEMSGFVVSNPSSGKKQDRDLEQEILDDWIRIQNKYMNR